MIQSVFPSPSASLGASPAAPLDALLQLTASPAQTPDFAALLAQSALPTAAREATTTAPAVLPAVTAAPAPVTTFAAEPGNPLPPALPDIAAPSPPPPPPGSSAASANDQPAFDVTQPASLQIQLQAAPSVRSHQTAKSLPAATRAMAVRASAKDNSQSPELNPAKPGAALLASESVALVAAVPVRAEPLLASADPPAPFVPALLQPALLPAPGPGGPDAPSELAISPEAPFKTSPHPAPAVPANPSSAPQAVADAAPQAAFLRAEIAPIAPQPGQPDLPPETPQQVARTPSLLRIEIAAPGAGEPAAKALDKVQPAASRAITTELLAPVQLPGSQDTASLQAAAAPVVPAPTASPRPHDFAALVDRWVAAREAVQPQGATLTVAHAEFGPVELRFRHETRGLAVSLTSADPEFARAAAIASPLNLPVSAASFVTAETSQSALVRDNTSSAGGAAGGQSRGQQPERRGEAAQQFNHSPQRTTTRDAARRSGIFA